MKIAGNKLLRTLGNVAESGYGRGVFAQCLIKKAIVSDTQKRIAIISTHIICDPKIIYHLLFQCNALDIILNVIFDETEALSNEAALGLTILALNLNIAIKDNGHCGAHKEEDVNNADESNDLLTLDTTDEIVTFHVKENQQFRIKKSILIDNSDVFNSMFRNDFRESKHNEVHLEEISLGGIRYFCHLIKLASTNELDKVTSLGIYGMQSTLEAYDLSIKYILPEIEAVVLRIIKTIMHDSSVLKVFDWSMRNLNRELLDTSIAYFLNCDISGERKVVLFRSANMSSYKTEWHQLIVDTIFNKCSPILE
jgi:armadillo repeat-containing protein 5